ncbi:CBS domain-containing protein [Halococcus saccharolyticus]|uniref:Putative inosine monophosphate dehydrogenase n=1 Tax=Halococcus saccharolyticus DSM 5350 TaxID=1227455 RepID=M0MBL2_9EURY|nr:CBS domain-containing protein [Halococcus saccharolyticus]EMA42738.1 putative inosine monophosphate dehydrogenase [Halococcus saccharolyticus DSM 5350]
MNVADAMTPRDALVTVSLPGTRDDALEYLQEREFSSVPVVKDEDGEETFRGLVSRQTLIERPDEDQLALLAENGPTTTADTAIEDAAHLMVTEGARRVPVVDGRLEGIVTITDVIRAIAEGEVAGDTEVGDLASRTVNTVYVDTPLTVAEREISYADVPYAVVLGDDTEMCGVLTEVDILDVARIVEGEADTGESIANQDDEWMWEGIKAVGNRYLPTRNVEIPAEPVREFMTSDVVTVGKTQPAREVAQAMLTHDIEQIPLVSGGELVGVVRDANLLENLYDRS